MAKSVIYRSVKRTLIIPGAVGPPPLVGTDWPGLPGGNNPVGFAATPAVAPAAYSVPGWPGAWPGAFANAAATSGQGETMPHYCGRVGNFTSGTITAPKIVKFVDFDGGPNSGSPDFTANPAFITADGTSSGSPISFIDFIGCRFTSNANGKNSMNVNLYSAQNIRFFYCTFSPRAQLLTSPPRGPLGVAWPSAGAQAAISSSSPNYLSYCTSMADSFQYIMDPSLTGGLVVDHCDSWCGSAINLKSSQFGTIPGPQTFTDNWIHDYADCNTPIPSGGSNYHTDGIGFPTGGPAPVFLNPGDGVLIHHNTFGTIGNTEFIAFQETATGQAPTDPGGQKPNNGTAAWDASLPWAAGAQVFDGVDGNLYNNVSGTSLTGGPAPHLASSANWTSAGVGNYHNITCTNNYFSGQVRSISPAWGLAGSSNLVYTDNVVGTDLVSGYFIYTPPTSIDGFSVFGRGLFINPVAATSNNVWARNKVLIVPGDTWSSTTSLVWQSGITYGTGTVIVGSDNHVYVAGSPHPLAGVAPPGTGWNVQTPVQVAAGYYLWPNGPATVATTDWTYT